MMMLNADTDLRGQLGLALGELRAEQAAD